MKQKTGKITALFLVSVMALAGTSVGYAMWSETLYIDGTVNTGELDWEFTWAFSTPEPDGIDWTCDPGFGNIRLVDPPKDVGSINVNLVDTDGDLDDDTVEITLNNVYPCYFQSVSMEYHINGNIALIIDHWEVNGVPVTPGYTITILNGAIEIMILDGIGTQMHPSQHGESSLRIHVLQPAIEGTTYTFTVSVVGVQYNEYQP